MKKIFAISIFCLFLCNPATGEDTDLQRGAGYPKIISSLPQHVIAPEGQVTLFADFKDVRDENVVLYLINRTNEIIRFDSQDNDIYVKLEFKNDNGKWIRAQTHSFSFCGTSYIYGRELKPEHYFQFLGYYPSKGDLKEIRYRRYSGALGDYFTEEEMKEESYRGYAMTKDIISNVGTGRVIAAEIKESYLDRMAINTGDLDFLSKIATGKLEISQQNNKAIRQDAIRILSGKRFKREEVIPILQKLLNDDDEDLSKEARYSLNAIEYREKKNKENKSKIK